MMRLIDSGRRNRMATVFFYLNNVTKGGHTGFPRAGGLPTPHDYKDCTRGISVSPAKVRTLHVMHVAQPLPRAPTRSALRGLVAGQGHSVLQSTAER